MDAESEDEATAELLRRRQVEAVGTAFLRRRPLIVAPGAVFVLGLLARAGVPRAQLLTLAAINACLVGFFLWELWTYRRRQIGFGRLFASLAFTLVGVTAGCAVTGGIRSPLV